MQLVISGLDVGKYIQPSGFSESSEKVYDTAHQFTTADGVEIKRCRGVRKSYNISLDQVPMNVKNMLRSRSRYGYISCTVGENTDQFMLDSFGAQVIIQNDTLDLWTVSFTLSAKTVTGPFANEKGFYSVTCEGREYKMETGEIIGDITITNNSGGLPKSGICASQMSFSLDVSIYGGALPGVSSSAECKIGNFTAPTYYVTGRQLEGSVYTITGTDRTIFLDMPFNYTSCQWEAERSKDNTVSTSSVVQSIASQAGFKGFNYGNIPEIIPRLPYADLATSCRSILTSLSEIACGVWYCGQSDSLQFFGYGDQSAVYTPFPNESTDLQKGISVGPMAGVIMINDSTDSGDSEQFTAGYVEDSFRAVKIVSKYATASTCGALLNRIKDVEYTAFTLPHCYCYTYYPIGTQVVMNEYDTEFYLATNVTIYLSPTGSYASFSGDASSEFEWDFSGQLTQQVKNRIAENTKYHGVSLSKKEGLVCDGVAGKIIMADGEINFYSSSSTSSNSAKARLANTDDTGKKEPRTKLTIRGSRIIFSSCEDDEDDTGNDEESINMENEISLMTLRNEESNGTEKDNVTDTNAINNDTEFIKKVFPEDYSLTLTEGGILEYDGTIIEKQDFLYVEKIDDNTAIVAYPNAKYKCTRTIDGNKHYYKTERIE